MRKEGAVAIAVVFAFCTVGCAADGAGTVTKVSTSGGPAEPGMSQPSPGTPALPSDPTTPSDPTAPSGPGSPSDPSAPGSPVGAATWKVETSGTTDPIVGVWGSGAKDVWAVGTHEILHSAGDGAWTQLATSTDDQYTAVFGSEGAVYVAGMKCDAGLCDGGVLLTSRDGGAPWSRQVLAAPAWGFARGGDGTLYLAVDGAVLASKDGFQTSVSHSIDSLPATHGVYAAAGGGVYAFGGARTFEIRRSDDGGAAWSSAYSGTGGSRSGSVNAMWGAGQTIFAVATGATVPRTFGALLRSDDGGASFAPAPLPDLDGVTAVWGASSDDVYIAGSRLLHAGDGHTFAAVALPATASWTGVWGSSASDVYVVGFGGTIVHLR
jgi:hypothetical protein